MTKNCKLRYEQAAVLAYKKAFLLQVEQSCKNAINTLETMTAELQKSTLEVQKLEIELKSIQSQLEIRRSGHELLAQAVAQSNAHCATLDFFRKAFSTPNTIPSQ